MAQRPVLQWDTLPKRPITEDELDKGYEHAKISRPEVRYTKGKKKGLIKQKAYVGQTLERHLLRILGNTALWRRERQPAVILPLLAANVVRDAVPTYADVGRPGEMRYEGYKRAVMKMMSIRRVWQMKRDAEKKEAGIPIPDRIKQVEHPEDPSSPLQGQLRLIS